MTPYSTPGEISTAGGMAKLAPLVNASFSLAVGDNFYSSGIKTDVTDARFKNTFEDVFTGPSLQSPFEFFVIAGNHDHVIAGTHDHVIAGNHDHVIAGNHDHGGNVTAQIAYSGHSSRWNYPTSWYSFVKPIGSGGSAAATLEIVMIDTVILGGNSDIRDNATGEVLTELPGSALPGAADASLASAQMAWLEQTLRASTATFLVVAGHYPVWSICEHGPTSQMVSDVKPLLEQYHVTAFIAGHDHCMESFVDSGVDYHGMGASHNNDKSTVHKSKVPAGKRPAISVALQSLSHCGQADQRGVLGQGRGATGKQEGEAACRGG